MFDELKNEGLIIEFTDMVNKAEEFKNDMDTYCEFMKEVFLGTSCQN